MTDLKRLLINVETELVEVRNEWDAIVNETDLILSSEPKEYAVITFPPTESLLSKIGVIDGEIKEIKENIVSVEATKRMFFVAKIDQIEEERKSLVEEIDAKETEKKDYIDKINDTSKKNEERVGMRKTRMGLYAKENESLRASEALAHDISENINATVFMIEEQDSRLSHTQLRWSEMTSILGLSKTVMDLIHSRNKVDKLIVYGGLIGIIIIIVLLYYFIKH
ncbi:hypothetical protein ENUP19_0085G0070 [Entamoeba nuttalli]|uniref:Uncharacterized protein n=2 Tax=Entamoeba nuttalli TaxID=412467 RepID=K2H7S1_ENTNP|nr:hypothetical protein ENU1_162580 [Entamoeba nuttalli P19]EKE38574.1 hypothetical protein ENU1_162580 [Entamoeba nuttalli P19]|eukprot:XP_008859101.1 hypothetical protein ENU1_162580 [Entamoeba nuttalli P19]